MDFTREPIVETVITPKEGFKLVVRSSKGVTQEEFFVDAVEVVSFGKSQFFRSLEKPKSFLVPVNDYEILEVREARMILKNVAVDRSSIKIGGGREATAKGRESAERTEGEAPMPEHGESSSETTPSAEQRGSDKKRDRRTRHRRRRGREERAEAAPGESSTEEGRSEERINLPEPQRGGEGAATPQEAGTTAIIASLLPPPTTLISETIARYKDNVLFKGAFYMREEGEKETTEEGISGEEASTTKFEREEGQYPSLDVIDEEIDKPQLPENKPKKFETEGENSLSKEDLWDFSDNPQENHL